MSGIYRLSFDGIPPARKVRFEIHGTELLSGIERSVERRCPCRCNQTESLYENRQFGQDTSSRKQTGIYDHRGAAGIDRHPDEERGGKTGLPVLLLLRIADKRYHRVEMGKRLCGQRTVSVGGRDAEDKGTDLSATLTRSVAVDARTGREDSGRCSVRPTLHDAYQHSAQTMGESGGYRQAVFVPHRAAHVRHDDADAGSRPLHDLEIARPYRREDDASLRQNRQSQEGRGGKSRERIVRLIRNQSSAVRKMVYFTMGAYRRKRK